jgi:hypothetical protein
MCSNFAGTAKVCTEILIHIEQHYDDNMWQVLFHRISLSQPHYYLGIGYGLRVAQCGGMLKRIEEVLLNEHSDYVMVYGDTNSTLARDLSGDQASHINSTLSSTFALLLGIILEDLQPGLSCPIWHLSCGSQSIQNRFL